MSRNEAWRFAFVLGLFLTAILGVLLYGERTLLIIGVCAAVTPVINGIFGAAPGSEPYLQRAARSALSAGWFFRLVTAAAWLAVATMGLTAGMRSLQSTRRVTVTGRVYAANGSPATGARVEVSNGGQNTVCDTTGAFTLSAVVDRMPPRSPSERAVAGTTSTRSSRWSQEGQNRRSSST